jgi:hypothetical protein
MATSDAHSTVIQTGYMDTHTKQFELGRPVVDAHVIWFKEWEIYSPIARQIEHSPLNPFRPLRRG